MSTDGTPDLSEDPVREPALTAALRTIDATLDVSPAELARFEQRLSSALMVPRTATGSIQAGTIPPLSVDRLTAPATITVGLGLALYLQRSRRWIPLSAVAAAAAVLVALAMTPHAAETGPSPLVAYAGGSAGARVVADAALGLTGTPADVLGGGTKP